MQVDLAKMKPYNNYIGFIVLIDVYTRFLVTEPVKDRSPKTFQDFIQHILDTLGHFQKIEFDRDKLYCACIYIYFYFLSQYYEYSGIMHNITYFSPYLVNIPQVQL